MSISAETQNESAAAEPGSIFVTGRPLFVAGGGGGVLADGPLSTEEEDTNGGSGKKCRYR